MSFHIQPDSKSILLNSVIYAVMYACVHIKNSNVDFKAIEMKGNKRLKFNKKMGLCFSLSFSAKVQFIDKYEK